VTTSHDFVPRFIGIHRGPARATVRRLAGLE